MIAFSGLDGAGKSTQINLLTDYLSSSNKKNLIFWSRGGYTPGMLYLKKIFNFSKNLKDKKNKKVNISDRRNELLKIKIIRSFWLFFSILDLIFFYSIYIRFREFFGTIVICDRYLKDTEIDFRLNFPNEKFYEWYSWKFLRLFAVRPRKHFVFIIPVSESIRRSKLKNEPFPDSKKILRERLDYYQNYINEESKAVQICGLKSIQDVHSKIMIEIK